MTRTAPPRAVAFDVVETLFSLDPVGAAQRNAGLDAHGLDRFFTRLLRDGFALAATGAYRPFHQVADAALTALTAVAAGLDRTARQQVLDAFGRLEAHTDARPALERLSGAGIPVAALTNGSARTTGALLDRAGLVTRVISIDHVQQWKPAPAVYRHAADVLEVAPRELALMAVRSWDVHGAHHAGLITGWASRLESTFPAIFTPPDITGTNLIDVAEGLLTLGET